MSDIEIEYRSSDGSDSEGSLVDFIVKGNDDDDDDVEIEVQPDTRDEVTQLVEDFPFDKELLKEDTSGGLRRSRRNRKQATRYQDANYSKLMYDDVDMGKLSESDDEQNNNDEEDFSMEEMSEGESSDESEYDEEEDD